MHLIHSGPVRNAWDQTFGLGASGVSFFYILSGFVLVWSARPDDTRWRFWRRRVAKIYPNHVVTWLAVILVMLAWGDRVASGPAVANLFLVQTWTPAPGYAYSINDVSWSLSCEAFFYLCLPFVLPTLRRMRTRWLYAILIALPILIYLADSMNPLPATDQWWFSQLFPPARSLEFWMGVLAGVLTVRRRWYGPGLWTATLLFVAAYVANGQIIPGGYWLADLTPFFVMLIAAGAHADLRGARSPWRWPVLVWLGEVSFAFYLVHVAVIRNVLRVLHHGTGRPPLQAAAIIAGLLAVCLLVAWLLFRFVEMPMTRRLGRSRRPRTVAPVPLPAAVPAQRGGSGDAAPVASREMSLRR
jgi:peptidoglycan/LPS O-acetylase OafA/YrhL